MLLWKSPQNPPVSKGKKRIVAQEPKHARAVLPGVFSSFLEHCAPRLPAEYTKGALGALVLLQTSRPAKELRRNIRLVGQTLRGGEEWGWLQTQKPETVEARGAAEDERLAGTIEDLIEEAREAVGHDWEADLE